MGWEQRRGRREEGKDVADEIACMDLNGMVWNSSAFAIKIALEGLQSNPFMLTVNIEQRHFSACTF